MVLALAAVLVVLFIPDYNKKIKDYGNKIFYRSPSVLPSPKDRAEAISIIVNEPSRWDDALEEYMKKKWMSEKEHVHKGGDKE